MFVGSIQAPVRAVVAECCAAWRGRPIYVGCSGNFTIEQIVAPFASELHGNDVSLYTCALGSFLSGQRVNVEIPDEKFAWLRPYIAEGGSDACATIMLSLDFAENWLREGRFYQRVAEASRKRWADLHKATRQRIEDVHKTLVLRSFTAGDVVRYIEAAPASAGVIAFPPTYKAGYERMYKHLGRIFRWVEPQYDLFDEAAMVRLVDAMRAHDRWLISWDRPIEALAGHQIALCQTTTRSHPVYVYASKGTTQLSIAHQELEPIGMEAVTDSLDEPLNLREISQAQLNWVRIQYLGEGITLAAAQWRLALCSGDRLVGVMAFSIQRIPGCESDAYMMTDLAVRPTAFQRLSKLVAAAALSQEVQAYLSQKLCGRCESIATTAFTEKPVSMKYRGVFDVQNRKPGMINYVGRCGQRTLVECLAWWKQNHAIR